MANESHIELLKCGPKVWNDWRNKNIQIKPDLREANLSKMDFHDPSLGGPNLSEADLYMANLSEANFLESNFSNANLYGANLKRTILADSILSNANFEKADLKFADLSICMFSENTLFIEADLSHADLHYSTFINADFSKSELNGTNLCSTNLAGANFMNTVFGNTILGDSDLSNVKNLNSCVHRYPSTIDHRTILKFNKFPINFLKGCGLLDNLIEYYLSLINEPIQFYSCFISYASADEEFAKRLHADLQNNGVRCWFAPENLKIGDKIRFSIDNAIRIYDKLLLIISENSIKSNWVEDEVDSAIEKENITNKIILFPISLDKVVFETPKPWAAKIRRSRHIGEFQNWKNYDMYNKSFKRLLRDLKE